MRHQGKILLILILLLVFYSCKRSPGLKNLQVEYSSQDSVKVDLRLYNVSKKFYPILDSVIASIENCASDFDEPEKFVCYVEIENDTTKVTLEYIKFSNINYSTFAGVFLHQNFEFYLEGKIINSLFEVKDKKLSFKTKAYDLNLIDIDDSGSMWVYDYRDDQFKCILYSNCNSSWFDESYFIPKQE